MLLGECAIECDEIQGKTRDGHVEAFRGKRQDICVADNEPNPRPSVTPLSGGEIVSRGIMAKPTSSGLQRARMADVRAPVPQATSSHLSLVGERQPSKKSGRDSSGSNAQHMSSSATRHSTCSDLSIVRKMILCQHFAQDQHDLSPLSKMQKAVRQCRRAWSVR